MTTTTTHATATDALWCKRSRRRTTVAWITAGLLGLSLMTPGFKEQQAMATMPGHGWFEGTVDQAMETARSSGKPLLLYWGAIWCPPCNELKSQVFSDPRFEALIKPVVAVALDGDSTEAQAWGDKLKVGGYPTVLLLDPQGKELMRLATSVSLGEFAAALTAALATGHGFEAALAKALDGQSGKASADDWRMLAYYNWDESVTYRAGTAELLRTQSQLVTNVPRALHSERALLTAQLLASCAAADNPENATKDSAGDLNLMSALVGCRREAPAQLAWLLDDPAARQSARMTLISSGPEILGWLYPQPTTEAAKVDAQWLQAMADLSRQPELSIQARLGAETAPFQLFHLRHKNTPTPPEMAASVAARVHAADLAAKTAYERHSVIGDGAELLRDSGQASAARTLLDRELLRTDTPWYYQSAYARLEKAEGHPEQALVWTQKARESARGNATRVQWIAKDLELTSTTKTPTQKSRLSALVREFYETSLALPDGFQGRNASYASLVERSLLPWRKDPELAALIAKYAATCRISGAASHCQPHFAKLTAADVPKAAKSL